MQKNNPWTKGEVLGKKRDNGEFIFPGQQSTFDKSMPGTALYEEVVCRDQMIEPGLCINTISQVCHLCDMAPTDWPDQDREKYHQLELQALLGEPIPTGMQLMIRDLGLRSPDSWLRAVICFGLCPDQDFIVQYSKGNDYWGERRIPRFWIWGLAIQSQ
jgi:hypothetical protein